MKPPKGEYGESNVIRYLAREPASPAVAPAKHASVPRIPQPAAMPMQAQSFAAAPWKRQA
ncbi:MAG: hypothetical protein U1E67_11755 [Hyphomicrobiales bacterium]